MSVPPYMLGALAQAGYRGSIGLRLNPGFGHGHVKECDTRRPEFQARFMVRRYPGHSKTKLMRLA